MYHFFIPDSNVWEFPVAPNPHQFLVCLVINFSHATDCAVSLYDFNVHFPIICGVEHFLMSSLQNMYLLWHVCCLIIYFLNIILAFAVINNFFLFYSRFRVLAVIFRSIIHCQLCFYIWYEIRIEIHLCLPINTHMF